jgi:hypothetical protein
MRRATGLSTLLMALLLGACAAPLPPGPTVMALPGQGKSFEIFQQDDSVCRQFASAQIGNASPGDVANQSFAGTTAIGTLLGAAAGAAIGAATGGAATGAAIGAASGLLLGSATGFASAECCAPGTLRHGLCAVHVGKRRACPNNVHERRSVPVPIPILIRLSVLVLYILRLSLLSPSPLGISVFPLSAAHRWRKFRRGRPWRSPLTRFRSWSRRSARLKSHHSDIGRPGQASLPSAAHVDHLFDVGKAPSSRTAHKTKFIDDGSSRRRAFSTRRG